MSKMLIIMTEEDTPEPTLTLPGVTHEDVVCPFSSGKWKRAGDALTFFMLFVTPFLFLFTLVFTMLD